MTNWLADRLARLRVRLLIRRNRYQEALNVLNSGAGADARSPYALANAAYCHCQLGHYKEALGLLDRVLQAKPDYTWAHAYVGHFSSAARP